MKKILFILSVFVVLLSLSCCSPKNVIIEEDTPKLADSIDAQKLEKILNGKIQTTRSIHTGVGKNIIQVYDGIIFNTYNGVYKYSIEDDSCMLIPNSENFEKIYETDGQVYFIERQYSPTDGQLDLGAIFSLNANGDVTEVFDNYKVRALKKKNDINDIIIDGKYILIGVYLQYSLYDINKNKIIPDDMTFDRFCITEDDRFIYPVHNTNGNLREYNIETRQERVLSGVGMNTYVKKPIERECVNVFCHKNDIYYSTYRPYALWHYNENGEDTLIIQNDNVNSFYECYDRGTYMYILQCTMGKKSNDTSVCKYNYESGQVEEKWELPEVGYIENADIIGDVLVYEKNNKLLFKDIPVS